jgi:integrase
MREAAHATHGEIDLGAGTLTIPAERMKTKHKHRIPLAADLIALIETFPRRGRRDRLFTVRSGRPLSDFTGGKRLIDEAVTRIAGKPFERWTFHDLRRTARTRYSDLHGNDTVRISDTVRELAIAHRPGVAVQVKELRSCEPPFGSALNCTSQNKAPKDDPPFY